MKILLVGDTHGDAMHWDWLIEEYATEYAPDAIVQLGDFGFWPHQYGGPEFLDVVNGAVGALGKYTNKDVRLYWIDGNHENFDALEALPIKDRKSVV